MSDFSQTIDAFHSLRVMVIGEGMLDCYLQGECSRLCPEAPVPVVDIKSRTNVPGGAANTALNLAAMGASVDFVSVVGDDCEGRMLRDLLEKHGVNCKGMLTRADRTTLCKQRVVAAAHQIVRFDQGSNGDICAANEEWIANTIERRMSHYHALVVSDYGYGILSPAIRECINQFRRRIPTFVLDAKDFAMYKQHRATAVKPNFVEVQKLLGRTIPKAERVAAIQEEQKRLLEITGAELVFATLDCDGALLLPRCGAPYHVSASAQQSVQCAGAGDTFLAVMALSLASGAAGTEAIELASAAAAVVVAKDGTASCTPRELCDHLRCPSKEVDGLAALDARLREYRSQRKRIVFTNGCFDILHGGHVKYLTQAKAMGDVLIVGVNSDESVRRLKGPERPINCVADRVAVLSALTCIDSLIVFHESDPRQLIDRIRPQVFVKGGDYTRATLPEADSVERHGGVVRILPLVSDRSTTRLIDRIRTVVKEPRHVVGSKL